MFRTTLCSSSGGQLYEYNFWYNHSVLLAVRYAGLDLHTGRPLTQSDYTRICIHIIVLLRKNTKVLEICKVKIKVTLVQALRLCTGCTDHSGSRGLALLFHDHDTRSG